MLFNLSQEIHQGQKVSDEKKKKSNISNIHSLSLVTYFPVLVYSLKPLESHNTAFRTVPTYISVQLCCIEIRTLDGSWEAKSNKALQCIFSSF